MKYCVAFFIISMLSPLIAAEQGTITTGHQLKEVEGWKVHVNNELLKQEPATTAKALELLAVQLQEILRVVPAPAVAEMRKVPLWLSPEYSNTPARAEYHPGADWLRKNKRDPVMAKAIEFTNIRIFERETKRMPNFTLHELAHAYHDLVVKDGFKNAEIKAAYEKAKSGGLYDKVEQRLGDGRSINVRAYAMFNPQEYFAECSEALFTTNDFYPFQREQLAKHDPETYALLQKLWGIPAEQPANFDLLQRKQMGERLPDIRWLESGGFTVLRPAAINHEKFDLIHCTVTGETQVLVSTDQLVPSGSSEPLTIDDYELSAGLDWVLIYTNSMKVWRKKTRGDYWALRRSTGKLIKLGAAAKPSSLMFAKLSPTATHVGYVCANNLYVEPLTGGAAIQLTTDGSAEIVNGTFDWVYEEEFHCRDGWRWSPDGRQIAYWQMNTQGVMQFTMVDNTTNNYPILKTFAYPKTGENNSACRIGVIALDQKETRWMEVAGDTRKDFYLPRMEWIKHTGGLVIQRINRLQNAVDVCFADPGSGKVRIVFTERDGAWVDIHDDSLVWNKRGDTFSWISERDGWRQLYLISADGRLIRRVTNGQYDVIKVLHLDERNNRVFYIASPDKATQRYLYCDSLTGKSSPKRLTPVTNAGWNEYVISKNGKHATHQNSSFGTPTKVDLIALPNHKVIRSLVKNEQLTAEVKALTPTPVEFFQTEIGEGIALDGWLMKPAGFDPTKRYPILFHVYGEPAGQTVTDKWGGRQYLWHLQLTHKGYVVACIDNRGTPCPRGRDWRKAAYRKIGTLASSDQAAAARELLKQRLYLDPERVAVWGWSGGGSATLNLLFRYPDLYKTGMAIASVPDMRLYNTIYQERYMGLPQANAADYLAGSPLTHAAGLAGNLLLVHGTADDNCHYQGMEKLIDRLVELNLHFTMMSYPNRSHSVDEGNNTTRHLYDLLTRYLKVNLPGGARAAANITAER